MSNFDFKLIYEEKIEKRDSLKPYLIFFFLGILPLFYAIWVLYSYYDLNNTYFEKEKELLQINLENDRYKKNSKFMMLSSRKKEIIYNRSIKKLKEKRDIILNKKKGKLKGQINFKDETIEISIENKIQKILLKQPPMNISFNPHTKEILITERVITHENLKNAELLIPEYKGKLNKINITGEIEFPKKLVFTMNIPPLKCVYTKDKRTFEVSLENSTCEIKFNLFLEERMVFPVQEDRLLIYNKLAEKIKNANNLKTEGNDLPLRRYLNLEPVRNNLIRINKIEFSLNEKLELIMNSTFAAENYEKARVFLELLNSQNYYRNVNVQTIFPLNNELIIQFSTTINLEADNG